MTRDDDESIRVYDLADSLNLTMPAVIEPMPDLPPHLWPAAQLHKALVSALLNAAPMFDYGGLMADLRFTQLAAYLDRLFPQFDHEQLEEQVIRAAERCLIEMLTEARAYQARQRLTVTPADLPGLRNGHRP